jgi:aspartyl-tRNA(Asn)/glutamyl-tRNA(Gln) amidotransferase subunit B
MISQDILDTYEMTIGIECHVQLDTVSKLFSGANNDARDKAPNTATNPVDFGLPGMLPVLNRRAVELAAKAGAALQSKIANVSRFDRKHYFYPDLPKGYQISQLYNPIIIGGSVEAPLPDGEIVRVRIHHAHLEEDAGKLTHFGSHSLVDLNRAGTPLIEIVSEPDIHSATGAKAYAAELHKLMTYAGVTIGDLYHGNMRFDVNISVAKKGATELGNRTEVKNLNSFRSVERAAEYEFVRQIELVEKGETITQETRGWDEATGRTTSQRSKEDAQDYRYMPDPDIPPIVLTNEEIAAMQADVPLMPSDYRSAWQSLDLDRSVTESLLENRAFADIVLAVSKLQPSGEAWAKRVAHWFASSMSQADTNASEIQNLSPAPYAELADMVEKKELSSTAAKEVFGILINDSDNARTIAERRNLLQVSDESAVMSVVDEVLADPASQKSIDDIKTGQDKAIGFLVGQVMKRSAGKANPAMAGDLIRQRISQL